MSDARPHAVWADPRSWSRSRVIESHSRGVDCQSRTRLNFSCRLYCLALRHWLYDNRCTLCLKNAHLFIFKQLCQKLKWFLECENGEILRKFDIAYRFALSAVATCLHSHQHFERTSRPIPAIRQMRCISQGGVVTFFKQAHNHSYSSFLFWDNVNNQKYMWIM